MESHVVDDEINLPFFLTTFEVMFICPRYINIFFYLQVLNYNHLMPTRYTVDLPLDKVTAKDLKDPVKRKKVKFQTRVKFEERSVYKLIN